jgi:aminoglycoside phosphotransferase (APT) family kinase protein
MKESMTEMLSADVIAWVQRAIGRDAQLRSVTRAKGATSSSVYFITATTGGHPLDCVLRLFTNEDWLADEPDLAEHEAAVLNKAQKAGLPAPELIAYAPDDAACGTPAVLMSFIEGKIELRPDDFEAWLTQLAERLAEVHHVAADDFRWAYFSWTDKDDLKPPVWSKHPELWERAIEIGLGEPPAYEPVFIHRDYHPTNVLWSAGKLCGIVDWVNGCQGPASVDLSHCRDNLVAMYGPQIAERFLAIYRQVVGPSFVHHPYWDIDSMLDGLPEPGYYPPWRDFGLGRIKQAVLRARQDEYLRMIMSR